MNAIRKYILTAGGVGLLSVVLSDREYEVRPSQAPTAVERMSASAAASSSHTEREPMWRSEATEGAAYAAGQVMVAPKGRR